MVAERQNAGQQSRFIKAVRGGQRGGAAVSCNQLQRADQQGDHGFAGQSTAGLLRTSPEDNRTIPPANQFNARRLRERNNCRVASRTLASNWANCRLGKCRARKCFRSLVSRGVGWHWLDEPRTIPVLTGQIETYTCSGCVLPVSCQATQQGIAGIAPQRPKLTADTILYRWQWI